MYPMRTKFLTPLVFLLFLVYMLLGEIRKEKRQSLESSEELNHILQEHECTLDIANARKLPQSHTCVIKIIREQFLKAPSHLPLDLPDPNKPDHSAGQAKIVAHILKKKTQGFYVEAGASNGVLFSNTVFFERFMNWTGILVEPEPEAFASLMRTNRKSWKVPSCLSPERYPMEVTFEGEGLTGKIKNKQHRDKSKEKVKLIKAQCFPLYSILLAHGRTSVDLLSLDVEGQELAVLKTIPWDQVDIKVIVVEYEWVPGGERTLTDFFKDKGFTYVGKLNNELAKDLIFAKNSLGLIPNGLGEIDAIDLIEFNKRW